MIGPNEENAYADPDGSAEQFLSSLLLFARVGDRPRAVGWS
jgi:hypothetical protein